MARASTSRTLTRALSAFVEDDADRRVIAATPLACRLATGHSFCGWPERVSVKWEKIKTGQNNRRVPRGPCIWIKDEANDDLQLCDDPVHPGAGMPEYWLTTKCKDL